MWHLFFFKVGAIRVKFCTHSNYGALLGEGVYNAAHFWKIAFLIFSAGPKIFFRFGQIYRLNKPQVKNWETLNKARFWDLGPIEWLYLLESPQFEIPELKTPESSNLGGLEGVRSRNREDTVF